MVWCMRSMSGTHLYEVDARREFEVKVVSYFLFAARDEQVANRS